MKDNEKTGVVELNAHTIVGAVSSRTKGVALAFGGAALWGLSGTVAQVLFKEMHISPNWLVTIRMLLAGILLLVYVGIKNNNQTVWNIWRTPADRWQLLVFGLIGMLGVQYTFFKAIAEGNAATATLLQFLGPVFITLYMALRFFRIPNARELFALGLALVGTYLLVTNGSTEGLSITPAAVGWGIGAAVTAAFYTVYPAQLLAKWGALSVVGWGMLIGGLGMSLISPPWAIASELLSLEAIVYILFVVVFGTLIPFYMVLDSLRYISPAEAGMLNSAEPLFAVIVSVVWLQLSIHFFEAIGGLCIIATVIVLASSKQKKQVDESSKEQQIERLEA